MNKIIFAAVFIAAASAYADHHAQVPVYGGVSALACDYVEGRDIDDLLQVSEKWNGWAAKNFSKVYTGNVLTPHYYDESAADVYWVGFSPSFTDQGIVQREWQTKGAKMQEEFDSVMTCKSHSQFAWVQVRDESGDTDTGIVDFSACKMSPGTTRAELAAADTQMGEFLSKVESSVRIYRWYPLQGTGEESRGIDYFQANWHESLEAKGSNSDKLVINGGLQLRNALYGSLIECSGGPSSSFVRVGGSE